MSQSTIPEDIQVLLDCVRTRDDLELEEMVPLAEWVTTTAGGELALSKAIAQNDSLQDALEEMPISVPKTLKRKVTSYVKQNSSSAEPREPATTSVEKEQDIVRSQKHYYAGFLAGLAALILIGASVAYMLSFYGELDPATVARNSVEWIDMLDEEQIWQPPLTGSYPLPDYMQIRDRMGVVQIAEFKSQHGSTMAYDLRSTTNTRGVLFVFESSKKFHHRNIGTDPDFVEDNLQVGLAKDGDIGYVLTVKSEIVSDYERFFKFNPRPVPIAFLLRTAWLLC